MKQGTINTIHCRNLQSLSTSSMFGNLQGDANSCPRHSSLLNVPSSANLKQVRYLKQPVNPNKKISYPYYRYRFSAWKRIHKFGLEARLSSVSQKKILWRRLIKGRSNLTVCDRILDHSNRTVPNREKPQLRKLGKKTTFPIYSYKPPLFKFRGDWIKIIHLIAAISFYFRLKHAIKSELGCIVMINKILLLKSHCFINANFLWRLV